MRVHVFAFVMGVAMIAYGVAGLAGCGLTKGQVLSTIDTVQSDVQETAAAISVLRDIVTVFFAQHPDPAGQAKVATLFAKVDRALDAGIRATRGAKDLTDGQVDLAYAEFRTAYQELTQALRGLGAASSGGVGAPELAGVPEPVLAKPRGTSK